MHFVHFVGIQNTHKLQAGGGGKGFAWSSRDIKLCEQTQNVAEGSEAVEPWGLVTKKNSSRMWITSGIPNLALMIHSITQEKWSKRKGAFCKPKRRTVSKYYKPFHFMPRSSQSDGLTGILRKADFMSSLDIKHP